MAPPAARMSGTLNLIGDYVHLDGVELDYVYQERRAKDVPIYIGATGMKMMELTGEIADAAYQYQLKDDRGQKAVVGVNKYVMAEEKPVEYLRIDPAIEREQIERVERVKAARDAARVDKRLRQLTEACRENRNVMPVLVDAVKDYVSLGEIADVYRRVFGLYREPIIF
mgnify:CR=1 FL=1